MEELSDNAVYGPKDRDTSSLTARTVDFFHSLKIIEKILIGFIAGASIPVLLGIFSLSTLNNLNDMSRRIIEKNEPLIMISDNLIDTLLAQELYGSRFVLSKKEEMRKLFWQRSSEFATFINEIENLPGEKTLATDNLTALHNEYNGLFSDYFAQAEDTAAPKTRDFTKEISEKQATILSMIKEIHNHAVADRNSKSLSISNTLQEAFSTTIALCLLGMFVGVVSTVLITRNISGSIETLKLATRKIADGDFEHIPKIKQHDEMWELAASFRQMGAKLRKLEEMHIDTSPLTRLPGGTAIENLLERRLREKVHIAFCLLDLDNFKAFNDRYGYANGSELIKATADLIEEVVYKEGDLNDFVGHIGGDDFALVTTPEKSKKIASAIIEKFDKIVPDFYSPEDRERGYIVGKTRQGETADFPFVSISIAAVSNKNREIISHIEIGEIAAELKEVAKKMKGSVYVEDRRSYS